MRSVPCNPTSFPHTCRQTIKQQISKWKRSSHSPSWSGIETVSTFNENTVFNCLLQIYGSQSWRGGNKTVFTFCLWWRNHQWVVCDALYNCSEFSVSSHFFFTSRCHLFFLPHACSLPLPPLPLLPLSAYAEMHSRVAMAAYLIM